MRKFLILLKKEVKELLTVQVIAPLVVTVVLFAFIGSIMSKEQEKANNPVDVIVLNQDDSSLSNSFVEILKKNKVNVELSTVKSVDVSLAKAKQENKTGLIVIPAGYGASVERLAPEQIDIYTIIRNFSASSGQSYGNLMASVGLANESVSNSLIAMNTPAANPIALKKPIQLNEYIVVGDRQANVSPNIIMGFVTQQTFFIPIILFIVIVFSSQMVATAIANEKENKTLETLLSAPVSRKAIVIAKMAGAGIIALLASIFYMFGFRSYLSGISGSSQATADISETIRALGLTFSTEGYILLGATLFAGILLALAISLILGAFAEDIKSVAGLTTPLMVLVMIPYFFTMFLDINTLSPALKYLVYAIPFSHIFMAAPNLFLHNYSAVIYGILYQLFFFVIFIFIAAKIFSTDLIVTMKLNFSKKK